MERLIAFDQDLLIYLNNLGNETWDPFWLFITNIKHSLPMFFVLFVIIGFKMKTKKVFTVIIGTLLLLGIILLVTELTKAGFQRERPIVDELLEGKIRELIATQNYSFFSGHTAVSFGLSTFLITTLRKQIKWIWILLLWAAF
ncbi:MAG: phosphatase PAP2 family protein, partial [Flavobacteriaceae bacterium]|nr:phosphatase PAP2 family protein [Flavobacteriaceae bacterium]